jgi:hypothetical protein
MALGDGMARPMGALMKLGTSAEHCRPRRG